MKTTKLILAAALVLPLAAQVQAGPDEARARVIEALSATLGAANAEAVPEYFGPEYIQHNPHVPSGIAPLQAMITQMKGQAPGEIDFARVIADGDMVALHRSFVNRKGTPMIAFDVFRLQDGKIVEHWDNQIPEAAPNPSGHTQIDGATEITDLDKTEVNKALVRDFITRGMINGEKIDITAYSSPVTYIQHNPKVADGLEGFAAFVAEMAAQGIHMTYSELHQVIGEGNFVLAMSEGSFGGDAMAFYDLFRIADGLIVEHWDVIAPMPGPDAPHNEAGKF